MTDPPSPPVPGPAEEDQQEPVFSRLEDWMAAYFLPIFCRPQGGSLRWCPQWNLHPEAVTRLTACWLSWESLRQEPGTGISEWLRDHMDYHLTILTDQRGPFFQCSPEGGHIQPKPFASDPRAFASRPGPS